MNYPHGRDTANQCGFNFIPQVMEFPLAFAKLSSLLMLTIGLISGD